MTASITTHAYYADQAPPSHQHPQQEIGGVEDDGLNCFDDILAEVAMFMDVSMVENDHDGTERAEQRTGPSSNNGKTEKTNTGTSITAVSSTSTVSESRSDRSGATPASVPIMTHIIHQQASSLNHIVHQADGASIDHFVHSNSNLSFPNTTSGGRGTSVSTRDEPSLTSRPGPPSAKSSLPQRQKKTQQLQQQQQRPLRLNVGFPKQELLAKYTGNLEHTPIVSNKKKRRISSSDESEQGSLEKMAVPVDKRERNREHAKKSRLRKKSLTEELKRSVQDLKEENDKLRCKMYEKLGKEMTDTLVQTNIDTPRSVTAGQQLIKILRHQNPRSTILNVTTLAYLKSLRSNLLAQASENATTTKQSSN